MTATIRVLFGVALLTQAACLNPPTIAERRLERAFRVTPATVVRIEVWGGHVTAIAGPAGIVEVVVQEQARSTRGQQAADDLLSANRVLVTQAADEVRVMQRRARDHYHSDSWWREGIEVRTFVTVPAEVALELETRGGRLVIQGERSADVRAKTGGGSIQIDGGNGGMMLATAGGNIKVARALGVLEADTSGGNITVNYIGPSARRIELGTAGGNIHAGIDPAAPLTVLADTGGGRVELDGIDVAGFAERRSHVSGTINGGKGGSLRASTSGGNISLSGASAASAGLDDRPRRGAPIVSRVLAEGTAR